MKSAVLMFGLLCILLTVAPRFAASAAANNRWPAVTPEEAGLDGQRLKTLFSNLAGDVHGDLKGVVILRHGKLVAESYFNGDDESTLHDIRSATKSITATLMGIAIQRRIIGSVDDSIAEYLPHLPRDGKEKITIRDLLNMRSGLDADDADDASPGNESRLDESADWIKSVYAVPVRTAPGRKYQYVSINAFLAGAIVQNASKIHLEDFAERYLFGPLGITRYEWRHVPVDRTTGQGNLKITTRDEAALGELFLQKGRYDGHQIVNAEWIEQCTANQVPISAVDPYADFYGYMWYTKAEQVGTRSVTAHFASGNGGNKIYVMPSLDLVIAITSSAYNQHYGQKRSQDILLEVLAATRP